MKMTTQEFLETTKRNPFFLYYGKSDFMYPSRYEYMGKISVIVSEGIVWFDKCAYCGATDKRITKNLLEQECCEHCNAPILWDSYL